MCLEFWISFPSSSVLLWISRVWTASRPLKFPITGAVFHVNPSFGLIYRHRWLILISLWVRQNWYFSCHIPFISQHMLWHTLSSFSAELLLRCRTTHSWMALCSTNGTKMNKTDKRTGRRRWLFQSVKYTSRCGESLVCPRSGRNSVT